MAHFGFNVAFPFNVVFQLNAALKRIFLFTTLLLLTSAAVASPSASAVADTTQQSATLPLNPVTLSAYKIIYDANYNGMGINAVRELKTLPNNRYELSSVASNFLGTIRETGTFNWNKDKASITDTGYRYEQKLLGSKKKQQLSYDHTKGIANYTSKKKQRQVILDKPYLNRLSYQVQLRMDLQAGKTTFSYPVISRGKVKTYNFEVMGKEQLKTPFGTINTVKVHRVRKNKKRDTMLWFAPELHYLLVQLVQSEDGEKHQLTIKEGSYNGVPLQIPTSSS